MQVALCFSSLALGTALAQHVTTDFDHQANFSQYKTYSWQNYKEGTLVVDLYDAKTKQLIWRGSAEDTLSDKAEKNEKNLDKGVAKMFKKFPPEPTKGQEMSPYELLLNGPQGED